MTKGHSLGRPNNRKSYLVVLEVWFLMLGVGRARLPLKAPGENPSCLFQLLVVASSPWCPWLVSTSLQSLPFSSVCVSTSLFFKKLFICWASLVAQMVKNLPSMQETLVQSLGLEDPLEEGMATHSSILCLAGPGLSCVTRDL